MHSLKPAHTSSLLQQIVDPHHSGLRVGGSHVMDHVTLPQGQGKINDEHCHLAHVYGPACSLNLSLCSSALLLEQLHFSPRDK